MNLLVGLWRILRAIGKRIFDPLRSLGICLSFIPKLFLNYAEVSTLLLAFFKARRGKNIAFNYPKVFREMAVMVKTRGSLGMLGGLHRRLLPSADPAYALERAFYFRSLISEQSATIYRHLRSPASKFPVDIKYVNHQEYSSSIAQVYFSTHLFGQSVLSEILMRKFKEVVGVSFYKDIKIENLTMFSSRTAEERLFLITRYTRALRAGAVGTLFLTGGNGDHRHKVDFLGKKIEVSSGLLSVLRALPVLLIPVVPVLVDGDRPSLEIHVGAPLAAESLDVKNSQECLQQMINSYAKLLMSCIERRPELVYQFDLSYIESITDLM